MNVGWLAFLFVVGLVFVFYVLVQHWRRQLRHQAWNIRRLGERLRNIEAITDPMFVQRLSETAPMPLEQVYTLSLSFDERFWNDSLHVSEDDKIFMRDNGSFIGSVKLERWRSHTVATITEVLPDRKAAGWQTRSIDLYSDPQHSNDVFVLWELALARQGVTPERPPSLELVLRANALELCAHLPVRSPNGNGHARSGDLDDVLFFRVPLDTALLAEFRRHDPAANGKGRAAMELSPTTESWQSFYADRNENLGIEWQLRHHDLTKRSEWERWRILETASVPLVADRD